MLPIPFVLLPQDPTAELQDLLEKKQGMIAEKSHRVERYFNGRPYLVYTSAFIALTNRIRELEGFRDNPFIPRHKTMVWAGE